MNYPEFKLNHNESQKTWVFLFSKAIFVLSSFVKNNGFFKISSSSFFLASSSSRDTG